MDLFSGVAGLELGLKPWVRTVAYCENDEYAQGVLLSRMHDGSIDRAPIWNDVRTLSRDHFESPIDIITGGFPCQDISVGGNGAGLGGERSGLFFEILRLCRDLRPRFVFLENSPAITVRGLERVCLEFTAMGYDCRWTIVSAAELGAPHERERWFMLAHSNGELVREQSERIVWSEGRTFAPDDGAENSDAQGVGRRKGRAESNNRRGTIAREHGREFPPDAASEGRQRWLDASEAWQTFALGGGGGGGEWPSWLPQPAIRRSDAGFPHRVDKLRCVGNACPPIQYRDAIQRLGGLA